MIKRLDNLGFFYQIILNGFARLLLFAVSSRNAVETDSEITDFLLHINYALSLTIVFSLGANYLAATVTDEKHVHNIQTALADQAKVLSALLLLASISLIMMHQNQLILISIILSLSLVEVLNAKLLVGNKWYRATIYYTPQVLMYAALFFSPDKFRYVVLVLGMCISVATLWRGTWTIKSSTISFKLSERLKNILFDFPSAGFLAFILYMSAKLESTENTALLISFVTFSGAISFFFGNFNTYYGRRMITKYSASNKKHVFWLMTIVAVFIASCIILPFVMLICVALEPAIFEVFSKRIIIMALFTAVFISLNIFSTLTLMHIGARDYMFFSSIVPYPIAFIFMLTGHSGVFAYLIYVTLRFALTLLSIVVHDQKRKLKGNA